MRERERERKERKRNERRERARARERVSERERARDVSSSCVMCGRVRTHKYTNTLAYNIYKFNMHRCLHNVQVCRIICTYERICTTTYVYIAHIFVCIEP